ncbi:MAG: alpha/beta hydrolase [bacterium]
MTIQDNIQPLNINGLKGRMLVLPSKKTDNKDILLLYGHHASIERMAGIAEDLHQYGAVTMPDFPGFGGMDSFYKIGMKPTLDNLADYLASFIKLRYKNKKITIVAMSFGFVVATRMLQKHPKLVSKVDVLVSVVGFCHRDDFVFSRKRYLFYRSLASVFSRKLPALFFRYVVLSPIVLRTAYSKTHNAKNKFKNLTKEEANKAMNFEIHLWHCNEVRTYMDTTISMLTLDNCSKQVKMPVHHVSVNADQYFNNQIVEQHMHVVFSDFIEHKAVMDNHAPSIIANKEASSGLMPQSLRNVLSRS